MGKNSDKELKDDGGKGATRTFQVGLGIVVVMMVVSLVLTLFPDNPAKISEKDSAALQKVLTGGSPHFAVCASDASNTHINQVFTGARAHLKGEGVETVIIECDKPLKSGKTLRERYALGRSVPTWFFVADGAKPRVIPPTFSSGSKLADEVLKHTKKEAKVKALTNTIDLNNCLNERSGGCVIAFSARSAQHVEADLKPIASGHRSITFARLPVGQLNLRTKQGVEDGFQALMNGAIKVAKEGAQGTGHRGELLLLFRRGVSSNPAEVLVTVGQVQRPGEITAKDVDALLAESKAAVAVVKGLSSPPSEGAASEDLADRLLSRDEDLAALGSVLIAKDSVYVGRAAPPPKKQQPAQQQQQGADGGSAAGLSSEQEARRLARQRARDAQKEKDAAAAAAGASSTDGDEERTSGDALPSEGGEDEESQQQVDPAELQRRRREQMEREAAESGFVAHLAEDDEGEEEQGAHSHGHGSSDSGRGEDEVDLDSVGSGGDGYDEL